jgi:hypothetical protein
MYYYNNTDIIEKLFRHILYFTFNRKNKSNCSGEAQDYQGGHEENS